MRAVIDLGTNTFHLLIINEQHQVIEKNTLAAKLGMGGISQGIITPEGIERGIGVLQTFNESIQKYAIPAEKIFAFGTSALRSAKNKEEVLAAFDKATGIKVQIIDGDQEAGLIYLGVKQAVEIEEPSMIVDIGGGSVEFIICNSSGMLWKQSFEIGAQRLMDRFFTSDPISGRSIGAMNDYLREALLPLTNAVHQYAPTVMIGSSGSYDTLNQMHAYDSTGTALAAHMIGNDYPLEAFQKAFEQLVSKNRAERLAIPGMIELRVDMIVVGVCLIRFLLMEYKIQKIKISKYAMKEGILAQTAHAS